LNAAEQVKPVEQVELVELVVFQVGPEEYALELAEVREVTRAREILAPAAPVAPALGIADVAAGGILLVSARERLGYTDEGVALPRMIVARHPRGLEIGLLVEAVRDVVTLSRDAFLPPPAIFGEHGPSLVRSLVRLPGERLLLLVSMEDLFSSTEIERFEAAERTRRENENPDQGNRE
jgi:purine-binding chemotaxis protein CheW